MPSPNIVFILTDDQGYGDLACTGNPFLKTPHIDRFHQDALRLTDFHVGPTCAPTRAGLLTGHYCNSTGVWHTVGGRSLLREQEYTLADALSAAGYTTGIFGKWHLGDSHPYRPHERGFQKAIYHGGGGISQMPDYWGNDYFDDTYFVNGEPQKFEGYCTDVFFDQALQFIEENRERPFFCYLSCNAPHAPWNVEDRYADPYRQAGVPENRARYYGMIENVDENFGRLCERLQSLGIEENTLLIFMTDNGTLGGCEVTPEGFVTEGFNAGMRGIKGSPHEGGHRVPFFLRCPSLNLTGGRDIDSLTANIDFMPTLLDLCGVKPPESLNFHGISLRPLLEGKETGELEKRIVVTDSQRMANPIKWRRSCSMRGKWRLIEGQFLYNLAEDPEQRQDVADQYPDIVAELREGYEEWWELCKPQYTQETPIHIGPDLEVCLTGHDWRIDDCCHPESHPYHQGHVRMGLMANGRWELEVKAGGTYRFELRRWPREAGHALAAGIDGDDVEWRRDWVQPGAEALYTGGKALSIQQAAIQVGETEMRQGVDGSRDSVVFELPLPQGPTQLSTWFFDEDTYSDGGLRGAYYVYVKMVQPKG